MSAVGRIGYRDVGCSAPEASPVFECSGAISAHCRDVRPKVRGHRAYITAVFSQKLGRYLHRTLVRGGILPFYRDYMTPIGTLSCVRILRRVGNVDSPTETIAIPEREFDIFEPDAVAGNCIYIPTLRLMRLGGDYTSACDAVRLKLRMGASEDRIPFTPHMSHARA